MTKINNRKGSTSRSCVSSTLQSSNEDEPTTEQVQYQDKVTEVDERTPDLHSKQGNTDITDLVVVDEVTQCEVCKEHHGK